MSPPSLGRRITGCPATRAASGISDWRQPLARVHRVRSRVRPSVRRHPPRLVLTIPVIVLLLAATAVPVELRPLGDAPMTFDFGDVPDILENIAGYLPVGILLGGLGFLKAILVAGLVSTGAETGQLVMMHRDPSVTDILANVTGAALGALASIRWRVRLPALRIDGWMAGLAILLALGLVLHARSMAGKPVSARGVTSAGRLEAHWKLDESGGRAASDASGHGIAGRFRVEPRRVDGPRGRAPVFDGANYIDFGQSTALRLAGSMTISAWIRSSTYPDDDAAVVSQLGTESGFQLDTTIDEGPRTIGFKLTDACGKLMARYGATPLALGTRYHVAGVYDAAARTLDVYLNGRLDNGVLRGSVSSAQRSSRGPVYVGRRGGSSRFNFSGSIADVRIYSFALTPAQAAADMRGEIAAVPAAAEASIDPVGPTRVLSCGAVSDYEDKDLPFAAGLLGALVAVAAVGLWVSAPRLLALSASLIAGGLLLAITAPGLPAFNSWLLPCVALAGGASVVVSLRGEEN